jgi:eukaryotic-like serine/threonine-protein kinase
MSDDPNKTDAVFVATINLGDFQLLQSEQGANQVAVLLDARTGPLRGTVLQHPLMDRRRENGRTIAGEKFQVPAGLMDRLIEGGDVDYLDPMAKADDGSDFAGPWIAAMQPIELPYDTAVGSEENGADVAKDVQPPTAPVTQQRETTDMVVLVQYRLAKVFAPVGQMKSSLIWEGASAISSILLVMFTLWYLVWRGTNPIVEQEPAEEVHSGATETIAAG